MNSITPFLKFCRCISCYQTQFKCINYYYYYLFLNERFPFRRITNELKVLISSNSTDDYECDYECDFIRYLQVSLVIYLFQNKYSVGYGYLWWKRKEKVNNKRHGPFVYSEVVLILLASLNPAWHVRFESVRSKEVIIPFVRLGTCSEEMFVL